MTNKLYKIATAISGEELDNGLIRSGARDDFYYDDCKTQEEKLNKIRGYADEVVGCSINEDEALAIMNYLDSEFDSSSEHYNALDSLSSL